MYLSRITLNLRSRETMKALVFPSKFHGAIESSFQGERKRNLWRIDEICGNQYLLLLSHDVPDLVNFTKQFGYPEEFETKDYTPLLERIKNGGRWRFRLTANPTISKSRAANGERGKICAHITEQYQSKWLLDRAPANGFFLDEDSFLVTQSKWYRFYKKQHDRNFPVSILSVTYEGILTVRDEELFQRKLCEGIGREKAYGNGLITVMRA